MISVSDANPVLVKIILSVSKTVRKSMMMDNQARNQLGSPGGAKSFLRGALIFYTRSNSLKLCPTHFSRGGEKSLGVFAPPAVRLVTGLCPFIFV